MTKEDPMNGLLTLPGVLTTLIVLISLPVCATEPIDIGFRLQPMIDDHLIERRSGSLEFKLHRPVRCADSITLDKPWEGNNSNYATVLKDGGRYLFYYRGTALLLEEGKIHGAHFATTCVMTSRDGIHWERPDLGFVTRAGWENNNILLTFDPDCKIDFNKGESLDDGNDLLSGNKVPFTGAVHNFTPFIDANPDCPPDSRFKALGGHDHRALYAFKSPDGLHWSLIRKEPVITDGMMDSQNLAFWDPVQKRYFAYYRDFKNKEGDTRKYAKHEFFYQERDVKVATSADFLNWTQGEFIEWSPNRMTQLYTSQIQLYPGAPHIRIGFPMRYIPGRGISSKLGERIAEASAFYASVQTDTGFIASRDGRRFTVWPGAFIRPGASEANWFYGFGSAALNVFETPSALPGAAPEWSFYVSDHGGWFGPGVTFNRYSIRKDGFVSASASAKGGSLTTKTLRFSGTHLILNFSSSAAGEIRVELRNENGTPIPGCELDDCPPLFGDTIHRAVSWKSGADLSRLEGTPVRLHFELKDADLYSFQFATGKATEN
jgi:hypothetical protein